MKHSFVFSILLNLVSCVAFAGVWDVDAIVKNNATRLEIQGVEVVNVPLARSRLYVKARDAIYKQTNIYPKLFFSEERSLNAYASNEGGQRVMVVTLGMVGALGDDSDAIAALIGHEMAHHVLKHGESRRTRNAVLELLSMVAGAYLDAKIQARSGVSNGFGSDISNLGGTLASRAFFA